jgi:hypothetical protein
MRIGKSSILLLSESDCATAHHSVKRQKIKIGHEQRVQYILKAVLFLSSTENKTKVVGN